MLAAGGAVNRGRRSALYTGLRSAGCATVKETAASDRYRPRRSADRYRLRHQPALARSASEGRKCFPRRRFGLVYRGEKCVKLNRRRYNWTAVRHAHCEERRKSMRYGNFCPAILLGLVNAALAPSQSLLPSKSGPHGRVQPAGSETASARGGYLLAPRCRVAGRVRACGAGPAAESRAVHGVLDLGGEEGHRKGPRSGHVLRGSLRPQPIRDLP